jgi:hypothetical protein
LFSVSSLQILKEWSELTEIVETQQILPEDMFAYRVGFEGDVLRPVLIPGDREIPYT